MVERLRIAALIALPAALAAFSGTVSAADPGRPDPSQVLVAYGFDQEVPTGPDSLRVIQNTRGRVTLSDTFRFSGFSSVELRDVPGDRDFPELQGFFPEVDDGHLFIQLALLTPDPWQELNIALAGRGGFTLGDHGIAFWLSTRDGTLFHTSDSIPKRLFEIQPYVWYLITADYDVGAGRYDLWVQREGDDAPFIALEDQRNAPARKGSSVHLLSLIGDNGDDLSSVVYYVDDVLVARDRPVELAPMIAPGRRRFFADLFAEKPLDLVRRCPPPRSFDELGIGPAGGGPTDAAAGASEPPALAAWERGCSALAAGRFAEALRIFEAGLEASPQSVALQFAQGHALVGLGQSDAVAEVLAELYSLGNDPRYVRLAAMAAARGADFETALAWLDGRSQFDQTTYFVLRAAGRHRRAYELALRHTGDPPPAGDAALRDAAGAPAAQPPSSRWWLRAGHSAFALRDLEAAREAFEAAGDTAAARLGLADVAWLQGDHEAERHLRQAIYGRLSAERE